MRIMISSEALHKGITKVVRATPSLSDGHEVLIETVEDNGILVRRQGMSTYAEFFLHCAVNEPGCVIVHPDGFRFLAYEIGDLVFSMKGTTLVTHKGTTIKTKESGEESRGYYTRKQPLGDFWLVPQEIKKVLWASNPDDLKYGFVYMSESYVGTINTNDGILALCIFDDHLPERKAVFPTVALDPFKDDEYFNASIEDGRIWFKCGGFMSETIFAADQDKIPLQLTIIYQSEPDQADFFLMDKKEITRLIDKITTHAKSPTFGNTSRCFIELREDQVLYIESNWSDNGQVREDVKVKKSQGLFQIGMQPEALLKGLKQLDYDDVRFCFVPMMGKAWPMLVEGNMRYTFFPYDTGWRAQNDK